MRKLIEKIRKAIEWIKDSDNREMIKVEVLMVTIIVAILAGIISIDYAIIVALVNNVSFGKIVFDIIFFGVQIFGLFKFISCLKNRN